ncbi:uncharacterized protein LOC128286792 [Gossypium arboreum]|uniref:uncharacterized protein LOC128286792 n=1 Tax=Gossypium arboreum TaxID=29729 RepID=UPI0022F1D481|nr:uncharacterized protein LOC128286792 [Gossypium arboreum]
MNGAVEVANKNIKNIVGKMTETYKDWHEKLPFALYAYRTSIRTSTGATPFSLVYGMEVVLPIEVEIPSLRVLAEVKLDEAEWIQSRYDQLNFIKEKRLKGYYLELTKHKDWKHLKRKSLNWDFLFGFSDQRSKLNKKTGYRFSERTLMNREQ